VLAVYLRRQAAPDGKLNRVPLYRNTKKIHYRRLLLSGLLPLLLLLGRLFLGGLLPLLFLGGLFLGGLLPLLFLRRLLLGRLFPLLLLRRLLLGWRLPLLLLLWWFRLNGSGRRRGGLAGLSSN
jgi:hypothetical protein